MTQLQVGDKIILFGGYNRDPLNLRNPPAENRIGMVVQFIKEQNKTPAAVVKLDYQISGDKITGDILIIEPRYVDQDWQDNGLSPVHIELCDFLPENEEWKFRKQGEWVEAAASWKILKLSTND